MLERGTSPDRADVSTLPSPRLLHTHLTYDVIPKGQTDDTKCKYIYVARNPKDVAVSFYEFMKDFGSVAGYNGPWEFFVRLFVEGKGEEFGQLITTIKSLDLIMQRCQLTKIQTWDIPKVDLHIRIFCQPPKHVSGRSILYRGDYYKLWRIGKDAYG